MTPRHPRRALALLAAPLLLATGLAGCGGSDDAESSAAIGGATVTGEVGVVPKVDWGKDFTASEDVESTTLVPGSGPEVTKDSDVMVQYWIGNGYTQEKAISTYGEKPEVLDLSSSEVPEALTKPLMGVKVGSRVAATVTADALFGDVGNAQLGISNHDPLLMVFDVLGPYEVGVPFSEEGTGFAPDLVLDDDGNPTAMRFKGRPAPTGKLQVDTLVNGGGEKVQAGDFVEVNYVGEVYAKPKPFDSSFDSQPLVASLAQGGVIQGWVKGLVGQTVGSRVWLAIPPSLGYGAQGNSDAKIKGTDTIYFVIDILGRAPQAAADDATEPSGSASPTE
ncbi:FKBP-type peptidyl-prolyl cis-trans isomerase [Nocardioides acrostichi]|uniref:peptidylprolyl isomerase n=1 Tax=Nocardioides acrostichi TaxID=2784339 RepID=A0A930Y8G1_9ACTN|nr:FKBP-type peptidyl-prolyl cis-trans isomerase [Nocardioides acrostichi]MBF4163072.1 FKBP-type peptidyl-prolyl cis-trans isomerase [Nocardioides acrostichi]